MSVPASRCLMRPLNFKDFEGQFKPAQCHRIPYKTALQWLCALLPHFYFSFACYCHVAMPEKRGRKASKLVFLFLLRCLLTKNYLWKLRFTKSCGI